MMAYVYLALAILAEVVGTSALKASEEFTKLIPSIIVVAGYGFAFYLMTLVLRTIPIGITYAVWSGVGIVLIAVIGTIFYKQIPDVPAIIGMALIISGVVVIHLFSKTISQ
jgi:small multidrug resistance pump